MTNRNGALSRRDAVVATLMTAVGVLLRAGYLLAPKLDSDQAVFGLQAMHVLQGEHRAFSWGYAYIGTLQTYLDAFFFLLFGPSRVVLNGVVLLFYVGYSFSLYYLAAAVFKDVRQRATVTALGAVAPEYFAFHGAWARHGYPETFFFGTLILALICNHLGGAQRARFHGFLFFIAGLAWWSNFLIAPYFVPLLFYLGSQLLEGTSLGRRARTLLAAATGFFLGSLPFWHFNLLNNFASLRMSRDASSWALDFPRGLALAWEAFPVLVGAQEHRGAWIVPHLGPALVAVCAASLLCFALYRLLLAPGILLGRRLAAEDLLLVFLLSLLLMFSGSQVAARAGSGSIRYLIPFYSLYPVVVAWFLFALGKGLGGRTPTLVLASFVLVMNASSVWAGSPLFHRERRERYRQDIAAEKRVIDGLISAGKRHILTYSYWDAYRLTFDSREEVIVDHVKSRYPPYLLDMFSEGEGLSYLWNREMGPFEDSIRLLGFSFRKVPVESAILYTDFRPDLDRALTTIPPGSYRLAGSEALGSAAVLADRSLSTSPPSPGASVEGGFVTAEFTEPVALSGLAIFPEDPRHGPHGLRVLDADSGRVLAEGAGVLHGFVVGGQPFLPYDPPIIEVHFPPQTTRRVRIDSLDEGRKSGFRVAEILFFASGEAPVRSDERLFAQLARGPGVDEVVSGVAAIRRLERALGRAVEYSPQRRVSLGKKTLLVFEREYLEHNLAVLDDVGVSREFGTGRIFAYIRTLGDGRGEVRWVEKALLQPRRTGRPAPE